MIIGSHLFLLNLLHFIILVIVLQFLKLEPNKGQYCFKPKIPVDAGMAAGLAVGITIIVLGVVAGGYFAFVKFGNPFSDVGGGISNPIS